MPQCLCKPLTKMAVWTSEFLRLLRRWFLSIAKVIINNSAKSKPLLLEITRLASHSRFQSRCRLRGPTAHQSRTYQISAQSVNAWLNERKKNFDILQTFCKRPHIVRIQHFVCLMYGTQTTSNLNYSVRYTHTYFCHA